jgi:hypothetical protein
MPSAHLVPVRCGFRPGSAADGHGTPASFSVRAIRATEWPASRRAKIHRTICAVSGSGSRRWARRPRRHGPCSSAVRHHPAGTHTADARPDSGPAPAPAPPSRSAPAYWSGSPPASTTNPAPSWSARHARMRSRPGHRPPAPTTGRHNARTAARSPRTGSRRTLLILPHHDRVPAPASIGQLGDQPGGLRATAPRHRPACPASKNSRHDHPTAPDQSLGLLPLPCPRRHRILPVLRRHPPVKREPQPALCRSPWPAARSRRPRRRPSTPAAAAATRFPPGTADMVATSPDESHRGLPGTRHHGGSGSPCEQGYRMPTAPCGLQALGRTA